MNYQAVSQKNLSSAPSDDEQGITNNHAFDIRDVAGFNKENHNYIHGIVQIRKSREFVL